MTNSKRKPKTNRAGKDYVPQGMDLCQTPAYAVEPLLPYLKSDWVIWEPAAGEGYLVRKLAQTHTVVQSDLLRGQNFFMYEPSERWHAIVTNPPFTVKYKFLQRCYWKGKPFALLMPVEVLGAVRAQALFVWYGVEIIFLDHRVNFKMPDKGWDGQAQFPVAWFTFGLDIGQQMTFAEIRPTKPVSENQLVLPEVPSA